MKGRKRILAALEERSLDIDTRLSRIWSLDKDYDISGERSGEDAEWRTRLENEVAADLKDLSDRLAISLDMLALQRTRAWFLKRWHAFTDNQLATVDFVQDEDTEDVSSTPYDFIRLVISTLAGPSTPTDKSAKVTAQLEVLEHVLRSTAKIVNAQAGTHNISIDSEKAVRDIMHAFLGNVFPDYSSDEKSAKVLKPIKSFVADAVVHSLRAAIEFKFADNVAEVKTAYEGILTDLSAYNDKHWRYYYSVVYMTGPYETEARFAKAVDLSGHAGRWTQILVNGTGHRIKRSTRSAAKDLTAVPVADNANTGDDSEASTA